jgi:polysaccharide deacetylase family sporulation protein PdaB
MKYFCRKSLIQKIFQKKILTILFGLLLLAALCIALAARKTASISEIKSESRKLPIYSVETEKKLAAFTFNCAWNIDDLDSILETLEKNKIKATFFMTGEWVSNYPEAVKKIAVSGHDLASHGDKHKHMNELSADECRVEINEIHKKVFELTGIEMELFRPPYGEYNDTVIQSIQDCGYYPIQWDVDSLDWKNYGVEDMIERVVNNKNLQNGSIILLHNGTQYTALALQGIIDGLRNKGYEFVSVSELILRGEYEIDHTGRQMKR